MKTTFKNNSISYTLVVAPAALRDEPVMADCPSAASVWANQKQKHKYTGGLDQAHRDNPKSATPVEGNKKARVPWDKAVPAEHFLESAPAD